MKALATAIIAASINMMKQRKEITRAIKINAILLEDGLNFSKKPSHQYRHIAIPRV
jgi:hypothetical protein